VEQLAADLPVPIPEDLLPTATTLAQVLASLRERDTDAATTITPTPAQLADCGWVANRWCAGANCCPSR